MASEQKRIVTITAEELATLIEHAVANALATVEINPHPRRDA
jgi:hypothetical protein